MQEMKPTSNREVKSDAFKAYFSKPEHAAKLYEALMPGEHVLPEEITFTTLENVLFTARKNDLAFRVKEKVLVISEHQSTINRNMPLRGLIYYSETVEQGTDPKSLYRSKKIPLPTPEFYVFYNGNAGCPIEQMLHLSDSYIVKSGEPMLELKTKVININLSENHPILEACQPLYEYSWFIQRIKDYMKDGNGRDQAILGAIRDGMAAGMMVDFLEEHGREAVNMFYTQFNMDDALEVRGEEMYEEGLAQGITQGITQGQQIKLKTQIYKKLERGKSIEAIAEELEETTDTISAIVADIKSAN